jgi:hypothetical protein
MGIGEAQRVEPGLVGPLDGDARRIDGVAELVVERGWGLWSMAASFPSI